jgi:hypothetical protein
MTTKNVCIWDSTNVSPNRVREFLINLQLHLVNSSDDIVVVTSKGEEVQGEVEWHDSRNILIWNEEKELVALSLSHIKEIWTLREEEILSE